MHVSKNDIGVHFCYTFNNFEYYLVIYTEKIVGFSFFTGRLLECRLNLLT